MATMTEPQVKTLVRYRVEANWKRASARKAKK